VKKITSYNIISHQPSPYQLLTNSRIPKGYFITHDPGRLEAIALFNEEKKKYSQKQFEKNVDQFFGTSDQVNLPQTR